MLRFAPIRPPGPGTALNQPPPSGRWRRVPLAGAVGACLPGAAFAAGTGPAVPAPWLIPVLGLLCAVAGASAVLQWRRVGALKAAANRYRVFYEHAPVAIMVTDPEHRVLDWNRAAEQLFGWSREEVLGRDFFAFLVPPTEQGTVHEAVHTTLHTGSHTTTLNRSLRRDGRELACDWSHSVIRGAGGGVSAIVSMAVDVTEARRMKRELQASERRFRSLAENANDVIATVDLSGRFTYVSPSVLGQSGYPASRFVGRNLLALMPAPLRRELREALDQLRRTGRLVRQRVEIEQTHADGSTRYCEVTLAVLTDEDERPVEVLSVTRDVTAHRQAREELLARVAAIESCADAVMITDPEGRFEYVNPGYTRMTGYPAGEVIGRTVEPSVAEERNEALIPEIWHALETRGFWQGETRNRHRDGHEFIAATVISPVRDETGRVVRNVGIARDITEYKAMEAQLQRLAHYDTLTGLPNRTLFFDRLEERLRQAIRQQRVLALMFLDLDGFKEVNDAQGHSAGDEALKEVGRRFSAVLRESDTLARTGGDEFTVLMGPMDDRDGVQAVADKLIGCLRPPVTVAGRSFTLGVSVGVALYPDHGESSGELLRLADQAMYGAKRAGRNRVRLHAASALRQGRGRG